MTPLPHRAYVALGANLGTPATTIQEAIERLTATPDIRLLKCSSLYRTSPIGIENQPDFVNAAALFETSLAPRQLLSVLLSMESAFGRIRREKDGPRTLDLDLLLFNSLICSSPELTLPHPRMHERAFVLIPLHEIDPDLTIPNHGQISVLLTAVANQSVLRLP